MSEKYKIKFGDKVLDPVHGFIDLTEVDQYSCCHSAEKLYDILAEVWKE